MNGTVTIRNKQRRYQVNSRRLRDLAVAVAEVLDLKEIDLGIFVVGELEMTRLNESFLQHAGCTDVITFDYNDASSPDLVAGEVFICLEEAARQATRFRVPLQQEALRYVMHGILHLCGYDDLTPAKRRKMKQVENRLVRTLGRRYAREEVVVLKMG